MAHRNKPLVYKVAVLGSKGVGKTAFVVRYITRRYIGDYESSEKEILYSHKTQLDKDDIQLELLDARLTEETACRHASWADGILFIYSLNDPHSLDQVERCWAKIRGVRPGSDQTLHKDSVPAVMVANKSDLGQQAKRVADSGEVRLRSGCPLLEISVAETPLLVQDAMRELLRRIRREQSREKKSALTYTSVKRALKQKVTRSKSDNTM